MLYRWTMIMQKQCRVYTESTLGYSPGKLFRRIGIRAMAAEIGVICASAQPENGKFGGEIIILMFILSFSLWVDSEMFIVCIAMPEFYLIWTV